MLVELVRASGTICMTSSSPNWIGGWCWASWRSSCSPCGLWCNGWPVNGQGASVLPFAFWTFSLGGGTLLLIYALYRRDPVFIAGQALSTFIYIRNLQFALRERRADRAAT